MRCELLGRISCKTAAVQKCAVCSKAVLPISYRRLLPCMLPRLSTSRTVVTTTGEPVNGANVTSGVNVNGAAKNGVRMSGASIVIRAGIETTSNIASSTSTRRASPLPLRWSVGLNLANHLRAPSHPES